MLEPTPASPSSEEQVQVLSGLQFNNLPLEKRLKPMNAYYLRLLEGLHLLLQNAVWEKGICNRLDHREL
jgi:hypothetical protein